MVPGGLQPLKLVWGRLAFLPLGPPSSPTRPGRALSSLHPCCQGFRTHSTTSRLVSPTPSAPGSSCQRSFWVEKQFLPVQLGSQGGVPAKV